MDPECSMGNDVRKFVSVAVNDVRKFVNVVGSEAGKFGNETKTLENIEENGKMKKP
ncbi:MAG TPA: hypothetical protein QF625_03990 [Candidatus Scalindua sp.]|jgi:hypothetical protein|nr:hypothetical protein [Candidatus Scalindua sp.]